MPESEDIDIGRIKHGFVGKATSGYKEQQRAEVRCEEVQLEFIEVREGVHAGARR